ncbi:MoaF C-terminal domain-containing protein [Microbacterium sp. RURRCA19A]|uniref:MoaF C-terminal domain-containing protein n=1 Tax=Microbacterium sp. RURRCA19A TaxID=1907391 RepID=UPI000955273A|nr:MoaF C-terminal domain-containing protein [Microbacterium sp. RURRCA19A]SIR73324.1 Molybdenum cofactor biosynthesis protein F [Microbacterium sp. RURRCA19A]
MTDTLNLSDTRTWLPLDGLAPGFDAAKADPSHDLAGHRFTTVDETGERAVYAFDTDAVAWARGAETGRDDVEVIAVDEGLYYAQFTPAEHPEEAVTLILDLRSGYALTVRSLLGTATPGRTAVQMSFHPARITELEASGEAPAPTEELIGRRVLWVYSGIHAYEHVYLSPHWYTWQCLAGPEQGLADTDENTVWRVRPGIYVFTWREKVIPCGSVTIADHRDQKALRAHGVLFGADESGAGATHFTFGAHGRLLSNTVHPAEYDPARPLQR